MAATNNSSWRELRIYQFFDQQQNRWKSYVYVVSDVVGSPGIQIIDLTALPASVSLAATYSGISQQHTVYLSNTDYATLAVPINTLPGCNDGAMAKAVTVGELQTTSVAPSGRMRKTALRALETSLRLRAVPVWF